MPTTLPALDELRLHPLFDELKPKLSASHTGQLWLALSGGVDSVALLYLSAAMGLKPKIVHVHHGLQDQADQWAQLCLSHASHLNLPIVIARLSLERTCEAHAREHRYRAIFAHLKAGDTLLLAHHASDQLETLLMRLCRGTSVHGLSGMATTTQHQIDNKSVTLWRPLLAIRKIQLEQLADQLSLNVAVDPTNHNPTHEANLRAHLRAHVTPKLNERFNALEKNVLRTADLMRESASILDEVCEQDLADCRLETQLLSLDKLAQLSTARRRAVLTRLLTNRLTQRPSRDKVLQIEALVIDPPSSGTAIWHHQGVNYRFYDHKLYLTSSDTVPAFAVPQEIDLTEQKLTARIGATQWRLKPYTEPGLCPELLSHTLKLDPVIPGLSLDLLSRSGRRSVKKILQEKKIAPWLRSSCMILSYKQSPLGLLTPHELLLTRSRFIVEIGWTLSPDQPSQSAP